jgi:hypothetical protein
VILFERYTLRISARVQIILNEVSRDFFCPPRASAYVKNGGDIPLLPPYVFMVWRLIN